MDKMLIAVKKSKISGKGVFARENIEKGKRICFMKGEEVTDPECVRRIENNIERDEDFLQVDYGRYIDMEEIYRCINHSCDPNSYMRGKNELVALKDIKKGEEITYDYSTTMWEDKEETRKILGKDSWVMECKCTAKNCRKIIDQFYLLPKKIQEYYIKNKYVPDFIIGLYKKSNIK
jgi:SET domain-containing protein